MSSTPVVPVYTAALFTPLNWSCRLKVFSYLTLAELKAYGTTCKTADAIFLREVDARKSRKGPLDFSMFLRLRGNNIVTALNNDIVLASYPRSGNSLVRSILEAKTQVYTGSDTSPNKKLALDLIRTGFYGEGILNDECVWITKSHYPERLGYQPIKTSAVVLVIRNPFDAISSYFHMGMTNTHTQTLSESSMRMLTDVWDDFIRNEVRVWCNFHYYWLNQRMNGGDNGVPVYIVKYEDVVANGVVSFLMITNSVRNSMLFHFMFACWVVLLLVLFRLMLCRTRWTKPYPSCPHCSRKPMHFVHLALLTQHPTGEEPTGRRTTPVAIEISRNLAMFRDRYNSVLYFSNILSASLYKLILL